MRKALTILLLALLAFQLGPACAFANATAMNSMQCCRAKCPAHSSNMPANCCRISASPDKATPSAGNLAQPSLASAVNRSYALPLRIAFEVSFVTYRSPAPPPERMLELFCSRQI